MRPESPKKVEYRIRAHYYTPMLKPLGVNVPGSPTSTIPGSAPILVETQTENPLASLAHGITTESLSRLPVKALRELIDGIHLLSEDKVSKSGKKTELIKRILASSHNGAAIQRFLDGKDVQELQKTERFILKLFNSLRGALRHSGVEILRELYLPYSVPALPDDKLPEEAHRQGECPDPEHPCLVCQVFGSLNQPSLFRSFTPPLIDDPDHKLQIRRELNHVLIRIHARNVHRPEGGTLNYNQQYFAGEFVTYLTFPTELPDPVMLGFLFNCIERCDNVGAGKAWGAGKLFLQSYTLEKVEITYEREWIGDTIQITPQMQVTPLKTELEQSFSAYAQWLAQVQPSISEVSDGEVVT